MNEWQRRQRRRRFMWFIFITVWMVVLMWAIKKEDKYRASHHQAIESDK